MIPNPGAEGQRGAGVHTIVLAISKDVKVVLTGYCGTAVYNQLTTNDIEVITGLSGTVKEVVEKYRSSELQTSIIRDKDRPRSAENKFEKANLVQAVKSSANQFASLLPILLGVILLIGLLNTPISFTK